MKRGIGFRGFLIIIVIAVVAVGFYRGWFQLSGNQDPKTEKVDVNLTVDTAKMKDDTKQAAQRTKKAVSDLTDRAKEEAKELREKAKSKN